MSEKRTVRSLKKSFSRVTERRMPKIVSECRRLGKILVKTESSGDRSCDLCYFKGVSEARSVMVSLR